MTNQYGYSLVELLLIIMVIVVLAAVAMKSLKGVNEVARTEETKQELDRIAFAIAGNPDLVSAGVRTDYGYVGDIGALPANLSALVNNPGGYATWKGPYIHDKLSAGGANVYFKSDAWGTAYAYSAGTTVASTGGTSSMTRQIANSTTELLSNKVAVTITDINGTPPGPISKDSLRFVLSYPDGVGGTTTVSLIPSADGFVETSSIPIGMHSAQVVYLPTNDTLRRKVNVDPGKDYYAHINLYDDIWTGTSGAGSGGGGAPSFETLRPTGVGSSSQLLDENCTGGWSCVNEVTPDGDGTFVKGAGGSWLNDTYATQNSAVSTGTIDSVKVYMRGKKKKARTAIRTYGVLYEGVDVNMNPSGTYTDYSTTYITNPNSTVGWTWAEIDALEIGVSIKGAGFVTQVWVEVYYTP